jgi:hypothetical protein
MNIWLNAVRASGGLAWYRAGGAPQPVAAYQPIGAASLAASYVNLANPGVNDAAPGVAPTWAAGTGWVFNGTTQFLTTGVVPQNGWAMLVRFSGANNNGALAGIDTPGRYFFLQPRFSDGNHYYGQGGIVVGAGLLSNGVMGVSDNSGWLNGVNEGTTGAWSGIGAREIRLGAITSPAGGTSALFSGNIQAVAIYNATLTAFQVAAVSAAMAAL